MYLCLSKLLVLFLWRLLPSKGKVSLITYASFLSSKKIAICKDNTGCLDLEVMNILIFIYGYHTWNLGRFHQALLTELILRLMLITLNAQHKSLQHFRFL